MSLIKEVDGSEINEEEFFAHYTRSQRTQDHLAVIRHLVKKTQEVGVPITYLRIEGMDHFIRHRPDVMQQSFVWLEQYL